MKNPNLIEHPRSLKTFPRQLNLRCGTTRTLCGQRLTTQRQLYQLEDFFLWQEHPETEKLLQQLNYVADT